MRLDILHMVMVLAIMLILVPPVGTYMAAVFAGKCTRLDAALNPVDKAIFRIGGVNPNENQRWPAYVKAMLLVNLVMWAMLCIILEFQPLLPLNPDNQGPVDPWLALNTGVLLVLDSESTGPYIT